MEMVNVRRAAAECGWSESTMKRWLLLWHPLQKIEEIPRVVAPAEQPRTGRTRGRPGWRVNLASLRAWLRRHGVAQNTNAVAND